MMDWTLTLTAVISSALTGIGVYTTMRVQAALTAQRAKEAFEIAIKARDDLASFKLEIVRGYVRAGRLKEEIKRLEVGLAKLDASVSGLSGDMRKMGAELAAQIVSALRQQSSKGM